MISDDNSDKTIGILSYGSHENYLVNLCNIISKSSFAIEVFTTKDTYTRVEKELREIGKNINFTIVKKDLTNSLYKLEKYVCRFSVDLLFLFPIYPNIFQLSELYKFNPECKVALTIYNVNEWIGVSDNNINYPHTYYKDMMKKHFLNRVDAVILEYKPIKRYFDMHMPAIKSYAFTPLLAKSNTENQHYGKNVKFVIPGHIQTNRRKYHMVLDVLENMIDKKSRFSMVLLGSPKDQTGKKIIERCDKLEARGVKITYYMDWVSSNQFRSQLEDSTAILSPMQKYITTKKRFEEYGTSKGSGCFGDAILYQKPLIIPKYYNIPEKFDELVYCYENKDELEELLRDFIHHPEKGSYEAKKVCREFTVASQSNNFTDMVENIINMRNSS